MARLVLLGVASAHPRGESDPTFFALEQEEALLLVDCGGSPLQRLVAAGLEPARLRAVFLTHNHADHLSGFPLLVHGLMMLGRREELLVMGNPPTLQAARLLLEALGLAGECTSLIRWHELAAAEREETRLGNMNVVSFPAFHSRPTLGLAVRVGGKKIVYSSDTGYSPDTGPAPHLLAEARGADILIHELSRLASEDYPYHTGPEELAEVAAQTEPGLLILVHTPRMRWEDREKVLAVLRRRFKGRVDFGEPQRVYGF